MENQQWAEAIEQLKNILNKTALEETEKWGIPVYTYQGRNVVGLAGFKEHFTLWFYNGVFLKDEKEKLINANEEKTKALRQWRFTNVEEIDEKLILEYIEEAIENEKQGKRWKPEKSPIPEMPELMLDFFNNEKMLEKNFATLTAFKQKEYIEYIKDAKRETTKLSRLEKIKPLIMAGKGLNDKYR